MRSKIQVSSIHRIWLVYLLIVSPLFWNRLIEIAKSRVDVAKKNSRILLVVEIARVKL